MWLGDLAQLGPEGGLPSGGRAQFAGCLVQHFGAEYGPGGIGLLVQPLLGEAIQLESAQTITAVEGDSLAVLAGWHGTTESKLRSLNPVLSSWPSEEPLPTGTTLLLPEYSSNTPIPAGLQLLVPGYLPSTQLPSGESIYLPEMRSALAVEEGMESLG